MVVRTHVLWAIGSVIIIIIIIITTTTTTTITTTTMKKILSDLISIEELLLSTQGISRVNRYNYPCLTNQLTP
jgi:hypothetical protein